MKVSEVMTTDVQTCSVDERLSDCAGKMKELNVGVMPVLDKDQNLAGIITDRDITVRAVAEGVDINCACVSDFMTVNPLFISQDIDVEEAAHIMADAQVRRLPVLDDNRLVGIIAIGDLAVDVGEEEILADTVERISEPVR